MVRDAPNDYAAAVEVIAAVSRLSAKTISWSNFTNFGINHSFIQIHKQTAQVREYQNSPLYLVGQSRLLVTSLMVSKRTFSGNVLHCAAES